MAFTLKSDVFHLLSFLKLLPSAKKNEELSNEGIMYYLFINIPILSLICLSGSLHAKQALNTYGIQTTSLSGATLAV